MINERIVPDAGQPGAPGKLVPFPVATPPIKPKPRSRKYWLIAGLSSLLVVAIAVTWWALGERSTIHYVTAPVAKGAVIRTVTATGTVNPELTIIVGAAVSGIIKELNCDYNTQVKKGQVCAKIDPRPYQSVVDQNRANLAVAKAQLEKDKANLTYAKLALGRAATLAARPMPSPRTPMTAPRAPTTRRWRRSRSTKQPFSNVRLRSTPRRSIWTTPTSCPRSMAPWSRAT